MMDVNPSRSVFEYKFHRRGFSLDSYSVAPGKTFANPNFVVTHHPHIHNDNYNSNSSVKDYEPMGCLDSEVDEESKSKMCKKQSRRNRKHKQKKSSKQDNPINLIKDMMDVELEVDTEEPSDISISPKVSHSLHLTDFLVQDETDTCAEKEIKDLHQDEDDEEYLATFVSISPSDISKINTRERQISIAESEDSFIIFEAGTTEEPESSEESKSESSDEDEWEFEDKEEEDEEDGCDEVDFAFPIIPIKKVRFAADSELCEIHTMVQWSFAYQQARKGPWEEYARDRDRFSRRLIEMENILKPVFEASHRQKVYRQRCTDEAPLK